MMRTSWTTLLAASALLLGGCGLFGSGPRPIPALKDKPGLRLLTPRWHQSFDEDARLPLRPAVANGHVLLARVDGTVMALNQGDGRLVWKTDLKTQLSGGVGAGGDLVVVGASDGSVIALDGDGQRLWQAPTGGGEISAAPLVSENTVVARTGDGRLVGMNSSDGKVRWSIERPQPALTLYRATSAMATRGAVFAGMPGGKLIALTLDQGKVGWEATVALPRGATELERVADVTGEPVAGERDICAATYQGRVACFEAGNGNALWARDVSSVSGLGADPGRVFVADEHGTVYAWERLSGSPAWKQEEFNGRRLIGALAAGGMVVTGDLQGFVHWLDRADGSLVARAATDGSSLAEAPMFVGDGVLVQTRKGGLYVFPMP